MEEKIKNWLGVGAVDIFGRPFSGKDTQARKLAELFGGVVIGGGDILRSHRDPAKIDEVMKEGGIIPSDFYLNMVVPYLSRPEFSGKPLILSAVGRAHGEEESIIDATQKSGHPLEAVVYLNLAEDEVWKRFEAAKSLDDRGRRSDDDRAALQTRLQKFQERTMPVIEFYRQKGLLVEIDGSLTREAVTTKILKKLVVRASE